MQFGLRFNEAKPACNLFLNFSKVFTCAKQFFGYDCGMTLTEYLKKSDSLTASQLASSLGVSAGRITQLKADGADWPAHLAMDAEKLTEGALDAAKLSSAVKRARE